jgi:uncharacterized membrane protein
MILFLHLFPGLLVLMIGGILYKKPPKNINWFWGYRTHYSMRNIRNWREANRFYSKLIMMIGVLSVIIGWLYFHLLPFLASFLVLIGSMVILFILSILLTEEHLKRKFGKCQ